MHREDKEITDRHIIDNIVRRCRICHLAMCDDGQPYIVPLNFGYDGHSLYFHMARQGKKLDFIRRNNRVSFAFSILHEISTAEHACDWGAKYESVLGSGTAELLISPEERASALESITSQYGGRSSPINKQKMNQVTIVKVKIDDITGKAQQ